MFYGGGLFALAALALWVYCILDVISTDQSLMRNLPKIVWLLIVIFIPTVGSIAWLLAGRPQGAGFAPGDTTRRGSRQDRPPSALGPDDDPRFIAGLDERAKRLKEWEEDLRKREEDLKRREDPGSG